MYSGTVRVWLYGAFRKLAERAAVGDESVASVPVGEGDTIGDVLCRMGINPRDVAHAFLNGRYSAMARRVNPGDRISIFPRDMALLYRQYFPREAADDDSG